MADKRMMRIIAHWTAGGGRASPDDRTHYHRLVEYDGTVVSGTEAIEDNIVTSDGDYAAHTLRLNTGSIGVAMCGMRSAIEAPFDAGPSALTEKQFRTFCIMIADLCSEYSIPVTPSTVLTHAEVQPTLGVVQRGKWDIARLPWRDDLRGSRQVGDHLRSEVRALLGQKHPIQSSRQLLQYGANGVAVAELQTDLAGLGYFSGRTDGKFGNLTRASVLAFQADNGLDTDGVAGDQTWAALATAHPRPLRVVSPEQLDAESGTAKDALMTARVGDLIGIGGIAGISTKIAAASAALEASTGILGTLSATIVNYWPALLLSGLCVAAWVALRALGHTTRLRRLRDAREHRSLAR